jgi:DNA-binding NarL/FixJ family response regulator
MAKPIRVLLADDHAAVRSTVRADLEEAGFEVCAEADDAATALIQALREQPDLCLLDIRMPGGGFIAAWDITSRLPGTKVLMLTMSKSEEHMVAALRAGAVGYILKDVEGPRLADQIRACLDGNVTMSANLARRLLDHVAPAHSDRRGLLRRKQVAAADDPSQRYREILGLLRDGLAPADIAIHLGVSDDGFRSELAAALAQVRYADRTSLTALSSLNA